MTLVGGPAKACVSVSALPLCLARLAEGEQRRKVVPRARGVVLEMGIGGGHNLALYDPKQVTRVIACDPSVTHLRGARARAEKLGLALELHALGSEGLELEPRSVDTVVFTYTLCTIPDVVGALRAARQALRADGELLFCEHALAPDPSVLAWQRRLEPLWKPLAGGCHLTRDIASLIREAGFELGEVQRLYAERAPRFMGFHHIGHARPA